MISSIPNTFNLFSSNNSNDPIGLSDSFEKIQELIISQQTEENSDKVASILNESIKDQTRLYVAQVQLDSVNSIIDPTGNNRTQTNNSSLNTNTPVSPLKDPVAFYQSIVGL